MTYFDHTFGGKHVRSVIIDGAPWFVVSDVCKCLEIKRTADALRDFPADEKISINLITAVTNRSNPDVASLSGVNSPLNKRSNVHDLGNTVHTMHGIPSVASLDDDNTVTSSDGIHDFAPLKDKVRGNPNVNCVNEPGLYRLIFQSRKKKAEEFKRWVLHEVLPSLRKYGAYAMSDAPTKGEQYTSQPDYGEIYDPFVILGSDVVNDKLGFLREARMIHGKRIAAKLWSYMGFPDVPPDENPSINMSDNVVHDFILSACLVTAFEGDQIVPHDLYLGYRKWTAEKFKPAMNEVTFFRRFSRETERAYESPEGRIVKFTKHKRSSTVYIGITLKTEYITDEMALMD